jgi:hypothetical protein
LTTLISQSLIDRYSQGPSAARRGAVATMQRRVRDVLGTSSWHTFLQGSYRNDTAISDINDVDIVALRKYATAPLSSARWETLFEEVRAALAASPLVPGRVAKADKCVRISGAFGVDIVPAAPIRRRERDPVAIYSRGNRGEKPNYPRGHYSAGVGKQRRTRDCFKPTVRLLKRWARQYSTPIPSFYLECAAYNVPDPRFDTYLPLSFATVAAEILGWSTSKIIRTPGGGNDILIRREWDPAEFLAFKDLLLPDAQRVVNALQATTRRDANYWWRRAFGD